MSAQNTQTSYEPQPGPVRVKFAPQELTYHVTHNYEQVATVPLAYLNFLGHDLFDKSPEDIEAFGLQKIKPAFTAAYEGANLPALKKETRNLHAVVETGIHGEERAALRENFFAQVYYQNELDIRNGAALDTIRVKQTGRQADNVLDLRRA